MKFLLPQDPRVPLECLFVCLFLNQCFVSPIVCFGGSLLGDTGTLAGLKEATVRGAQDKQGRPSLIGPRQGWRHRGHWGPIGGV